MKATIPATESELCRRAHELAGKTLGELAALWGEVTPSSQLHAKGWVGQFIEKILGASAANWDQPDFVNLGIELKTLPINRLGIPVESTYICMLSLPLLETDFHQSRVWRKMAKILWIPIEANKEQALAQQKIGTPLLWSPNQRLYQQLKQDWEELTELIALGRFSELSAHQGKYLQIRPKAANAKILTHTLNQEGHMISIVPKGFYLRRDLTRQIMQQHYALS